MDTLPDDLIDKIYLYKHNLEYARVMRSIVEFQLNRLKRLPIMCEKSNSIHEFCKDCSGKYDAVKVCQLQ